MTTNPIPFALLLTGLLAVLASLVAGLTTPTPAPEVRAIVGAAGLASTRIGAGLALRGYLSAEHPT